MKKRARSSLQLNHQLLTTILVAAASAFVVSTALHWADLSAYVGPPANECNDGIDNDGDGVVDGQDSMCIAPTSESGTPPALAECEDGNDNDGDGYTDAYDIGCQGGRTVEGTHECNDGMDNDGDYLADGNDPGCYDPSSQSEVDPLIVE